MVLLFLISLFRLSKRKEANLMTKLFTINKCIDLTYWNKNCQILVGKHPLDYHGFAGILCWLFPILLISYLIIFIHFLTLTSMSRVGWITNKAKQLTIILGVTIFANWFSFYSIYKMNTRKRELVFWLLQLISLKIY